VIRKENDHLSEKLSDECIYSAREFKINVEKFNGIYNDQEAILKEKELFPFFKLNDMKKRNKGLAGCFLSHYLLWEKCISINEPIGILEHDALFVRPIPDDILNLFTHHCILDHAVHLENYEEIIKFEQDLTVNNHYKIDGEKITLSKINKKHVRGSHAHLITPLGAKTIINSVKNHGYLAADATVNQYYTSYTTVMPISVRCNPFFTDIDNRKKYSHTNIP
jgi:glycosyl transferase family 25